MKNLEGKIKDIKKDKIRTVSKKGKVTPKSKNDNKYLFVSKNITKPGQAEEYIENYKTLLHALSDATNALITIPDLDEAVYTALGVIGKAVNVNKVYIFENFDDKKNNKLYTREKYQWTKDPADSKIFNPDFRNVDFINFPKMKKILQRNGIICGGVSDFSGKEREIIKSINIASVLCIPMFINKNFWGFIGFNQNNFERIWTESEIDILRSSANIFVINIEHRRSEQRLILEANELKVLNEIINSVNKSESLQMLFRNTVETTMSLFDFDLGGVYLVNEAERTANLVFSKSLKVKVSEDILRKNIDEVPYNKIFIKGEPLFSENYSSVNPLAANEYSLASVASLPLIIKQKIIGALNFGSSKNIVINDVKRLLLLSISSELSSAIEKSYIYNELKKNEYNLQTLINSIEDLLFVLDDKGKMIKINSAFIKELGYSEKELLGMDFILLHPPDKRVEAKKFFGNKVTSEENSSLIPLITKKGKIVEVETKISKGKWGKKNVIFGICRNIASRKKIEEELKSSEERWKYALEGNDEGVWDLNLKTNKSFHSARWKEMLGVKHDQEVNSKWDWESRIHPDDRERTLRTFNDHLEGKTESYICEHRLRCNDGQYKWFLDRGKVLEYDKDCSPLRIVGTIADITERKKMYESLLESDSKNIALLNAIPDFMFLQKKDGTYLDYISPHSKLKTSKQEYFNGKNIRDVLSPDLSDKFLFLFNKAIKTNEVQVLEYEIESDSKKYFEARIVSYGKDEKILTMVRDITDRKLAEEALISSENRYRILAENSKDIICLHKPDTTYEFISPSIKALMGYEEADLLGRKPVEFIYAEDKNLIENLDFEALDKYSLECRFLKKNGESIWLESIITTVHNRTGKVINLLSVTRDISERKKTEDEIKNSLKKAEQLNEFKSNFISTTSHEFRTPLAAILSSAELIEYYNTEKTKEKKIYHINRIKNSVVNMTTMLNDMLTINKAESGMISLIPKLTNIKGLFESLIYDLKEIDQGKHNICFNFNTEVKEYFLDPKYLSQAVGNLLNNAAKFSPHGGKIELSVEKNDSQLIISISDEGVGISEKDIEWIFEPFYRGKNVENISGTGLGLAIAKKTAELHSGEIKVSSNNGKGTIFTLVLPVVTKSEHTK